MADLESKLLNLSRAERAALAERLLSSLDEPNQPELDCLWAEEAQSRINAYEAGLITASDADEVFERIAMKHKF